MKLIDFDGFHVADLHVLEHEAEPTAPTPADTIH